MERERLSRGPTKPYLLMLRFIVSRRFRDPCRNLDGGSVGAGARIGAFKNREDPNRAHQCNEQNSETACKETNH